MRLLFIATQLPPYYGSGNVRALNYINHLSKLGHTIDVIGVDYPRDSIAYDESIAEAFNKDVTIYRVKPGIFYKFFYRKKNSSNQNKDNKSTSINSTIKGKINYLIRRNILIPDSFVQWIGPAYRRAKELISHNSYDCMISMHETPSSHLVAYKLKKDFYNLKWIGYWSDPWNGDSSLRQFQNSIKTKIEEYMEYKVITSVDKLLFTTEKTKLMYERKYGIASRKTDIVFRGYDLDIYEKIGESREVPISLNKEKLNIVHIGTIYHKLRDINPLCRALERLEANEKELFELLNIIFVGQFDNVKDQRNLEKLNNVQVIPFVPYEEALQYMVHSDVLLLYGNKESTQVPGKVYEYFGSNAAILTILGDEKDELKSLMLDVEKGPIVLNDEEKIYEQLNHLCTVFRDKGKFNALWNQRNVKYQWINVIRDLEQKNNELMELAKMKILHASLGMPPFRSGGLTKYSVDLMSTQVKMSHEVALLFPGNYTICGQISYKKKVESGISVYEVINPPPVSLMGGIKEPKAFIKKVNKEKYLHLLNDIKPNVIHIHSLMGLHKEFIEAAKELNIKTVFTTHDYFGICPKVNLLDYNERICETYDNGAKCSICNANGYSMFKIFLMQSKLYRNMKSSSVVKKIRNREKNKDSQINVSEKTTVITTIDHRISDQYVDLRKYYLEMLALIDLFHFNSSTAKKEFEKFVPIDGKVISITHRDIRDSRITKRYENNQPLQIAYLGPVDRYKGFYFLQKSLKRLKGKNWHLHVYGDIAKADVDIDSNHYTFHGSYRHVDLSGIFNRIDLLIIPSIWKETFGFIGLEALAHGVPILISEHVGLQDVITHGETGIIFKAEESELREQIAAIIEDREILTKINENILRSEFVFSMEQHTNRMIEFYKTGV